MSYELQLTYKTKSLLKYLVGFFVSKDPSFVTSSLVTKTEALECYFPFQLVIVKPIPIVENPFMNSVAVLMRSSKVAFSCAFHSPST